VAILEQRNVFATQFHPEKSGPAGARVLTNFLQQASPSFPVPRADKKR
jgi:glutamine amidotransferase